MLVGLRTGEELNRQEFAVFFHVHTWIEIIWVATKVKPFSESVCSSKTHQNDAWQANLCSRRK